MGAAAWWCGLSCALALGGAQAQDEGLLPQEGHIAGVVEGSEGPEAGVWVIAETTDLPTPYVKIVVTDDDGRFVIPELPAVNYHVWVRGYGLRDSDKTYLRPGEHDVRLLVEAAASPHEAAQVYPGDYWWSLLQPPTAEEFPAAGGAGRGLGSTMASQAQWLDTLKLGCNFCHRIGNEVTRSFDHWSSELLGDRAGRLREKSELIADCCDEFLLWGRGRCWFRLEGIEATRLTEPRRVWRSLPIRDERWQETALLGSRVGTASTK